MSQPVNIEPVGQFNIDSTLAKLSFEIRKSLGSAREAGQYDASTAAPEPDWVAELLKSGRPIFSVHFDGLIQCQLHGSDSTKAYGPTPALAAKACVERLRNQTPNPAVCGRSE